VVDFNPEHEGGKFFRNVGIPATTLDCSRTHPPSKKHEFYLRHLENFKFVKCHSLVVCVCDGKVC